MSIKRDKNTASLAILAIVLIVVCNMTITLAAFMIQNITADIVSLANRQIVLWESIARAVDYANDAIEEGYIDLTTVDWVQDDVGRYLTESDEISAAAERLVKETRFLLGLFGSGSELDQATQQAKVDDRIRDNIQAFLEAPPELVILGMDLWDTDVRINLESGAYLAPLRTLANIAQPMNEDLHERTKVVVIVVNGVFLCIVFFLWRWTLLPVFDSLGLANQELLESRDYLAHEHNKFVTAFESITEAVCMVDQHGDIVRCNDKFRAVFALPMPKEPSSLDFVAVCTRVDESRVQSAARAMNRFEALLDELHETTTPLVDDQFVTWRVSQVSDDLWLVMAIDQTEIIAQKDRDMRDTRLKTLGEIAGGVAHDFNNMLASILTRVEFLQMQTVVSEQQAQYFRALEDICHRGAKLTSQLLTYSRKQQLNPVPVPISILIARIENEILVPKNVTLAIHCERALAVELDPDYFISAIENLILNAVESIDGEPGQITIVIEPVADSVSQFGFATIGMRIEDTGKGFADFATEKAFEPFFSTKYTQNGTGLGLSMVQGFIDQSGGRIALGNRAEGGAFVQLWLPAFGSLDSIADARTLGMSSSMTDKAKARICLIVEDNADYVAVLKDFFGFYGIETYTASNCREGIEIVDSVASLDYALLDWRLPDNTSHIVALRIREHGYNTKIVVLTGYGDSEAIRFTEQHSIPLLRKPVDFSQLMSNFDFSKPDS